ncbi:FKBP-type peptidyl-prolyl cis-trans isomerase [Olivibacter sp. SDN3]|uniref:FKBP-type peptidyl-prolyl cis-trans isomerase n=1 Tax=Olivibacter sp. SDN3 TaxID=2764720 RepID=UPI0016512B77|nr:FKBP-type peptidyl-prolyl cis-trans isomerase [Olivibacter sp. SDN3]QNL51466.1 FKBP-type peptidyl-prolyl cis-trans isomerase [Olivibacter sp. SDN3]
MKGIYTCVLTILLGIIIVSCNKDDVDVYDQQAILEREASMLSAYITAQGLSDSAELHQQTGIWYVLKDPGEGDFNYLDTSDNTGESQLANAQILVKYTGKLLDGTVFDENLNPDTTDANNGYFNLLPTQTQPGVITAWQIAFYPAKIGEHEIGGLLETGLQKGAKIRIITPSPYAYRNQPNADIPANSPLDFDIEVLDIKKSPDQNNVN